jgi:hypothetical protein
LLQAAFDLAASMLDLQAMNTFPAMFPVHGQGEPRGLGAGIDPKLGFLGLTAISVVEDDGEGLLSEHGCPALLEQISGPGWMTGHQRLPIRVQDKYSLILQSGVTSWFSGFDPWFASASPMLWSGFFASGTGFDPVCLFNRLPQGPGLAGHPGVPMYSLLT